MHLVTSLDLLIMLPILPKTMMKRQHLNMHPNVSTMTRLFVPGRRLVSFHTVKLSVVHTASLECVSVRRAVPKDIPTERVTDGREDPAIKDLNVSTDIQLMKKDLNPGKELSQSKCYKATKTLKTAENQKTNEEHFLFKRMMEKLLEKKKPVEKETPPTSWMNPYHQQPANPHPTMHQQPNHAPSYQSPFTPACSSGGQYVRLVSAEDKPNKM